MLENAEIWGTLERSVSPRKGKTGKGGQRGEEVEHTALLG